MNKLELLYKGLNYLLCRYLSVAWSSVRDLSRWFLHSVGGLVRICLSFLSTLVFSNSSFAYVLEIFLGQLETIVWIERNAWEIGNFFLKSKKGNEGMFSSNTKVMTCFGQWYIINCKVYRDLQSTCALWPPLSCWYWQHCDDSLCQQSATC